MSSWRQIKLPDGRTPAQKQMAKAKAAADRDKYEGLFDRQVLLLGLPEPQREYRFAAHHVGWFSEPRPKGRLRELLDAEGLSDWRFDFAWPALMIAVEIEGGLYRGRHTSPKGYAEDCRKLNMAQWLGWTVLQVTGDDVRTMRAVQLAERFIKRCTR